MIDTTTGRQRLAASSRIASTIDEDGEQPSTEPVKASPGKGTAVADDTWGTGLPDRDGRRIDRRAEPEQGDVDDGALASAFDFIEAADSGTSLPRDLASRLEAELGVDLSRVRIHTDDHAAAAAAAISARAFTIGADIYFARGAFDPNSEAGVQLIAHEVVHVAENQRGTADTSRKVSRPDDQHERRADDFAERFNARRQGQVDANDPASLVDHVRERGDRIRIPMQAELEEHFGQSLDFVEMYAGDAARLACGLMAAGAFAVRNVVAMADATPQRDHLLHELTHVMQMGGRALQAPERFAPGSLSIGAAGTAAEHEAETFAAAPTERADHNTIHRATGPDAKDGKAEERVKKYRTTALASVKEVKGEALSWGVEKSGRVHPRYYKVSKVFTPQQYAKDAKGAAGDLDEVFKDTTVRESLKLHKVKGGYVFSKDTKTDYEPNLTKVEVMDTWPKYHDAVADLKPPGGGKVTFTWSKQNYDQDEPACTAEENKDYRTAMRTAIATAFASSDQKFDQLYEQVVKKQVFSQRICGDIFEECVQISADPEMNASTDQPVFDKKKFKGIGNKKRVLADGTHTLEVKGEQFRALVECKAYIESTGPTSENKKQMDVYASLLGKTGYKIGGVVQQIPFNHIVYYVTPPSGSGGKDGAKKRQDMLMKWHNALKERFDEGKFKLEPPPKGIKYKIKFNPEFEWDIPEGQKSINLSNPSVNHPGLKLSQVSAQLDNDLKVKSGSVTYAIDAADMKKPATTKEVKAAKDGSIGGEVDNKLSGLTSKLAQYLPVDIDAELVDEGVKATIKLKQGAPKGLAGFSLVPEDTEITALYKGGGTLSVETKIGIKHNTKDIKGTLTVSYDNGWSFEGGVKIGAGVIPGVNELDAKVSKDGAGVWKIGAKIFTIEKQFGAIKLTGTGSDLEYNVDSGMFKGDLELDADLGMFGKANGTAKIVNNKLTEASLAYDSPELKYPKDKPVIVGTVGGTVKLNNGKFSGDIRGTADLKIAALQKIAKEGIGLSVDAHIGEDGSYSGSIKSTKPITIGKHLKIPSVGLTLEKDGSLKGDFEIEIVNIKGLKTAKAKGTVDKSGVHIESAEATVEFGDKDKGKFWGSITAKYTDEKGFDVEGTANYKIKDDIIATGTIKYSQETNAIGVELKVTEITLFDKTIHKDLFSASKQIPVVNIYGLGIYIDIGLDLGFDFGFKLTMTPSAKVEDFSLDTMEYKRIAAKLEVGGDIYAQLTGTPKLGIGVFAIDPSIIRGGGGLKVPIVGRLDVKPKATFDVGYSPDGGADASAKLGISGEFGIKGSVKPYAEFALLNNLWNPKWEGEALAEFEILKPTELFNFTVDLNSKEKQEDPALPGKNETKAPTEPEGDKKAKAEAKAPTERGGGAGKSDAKQGEVAESGDQGPFSLDALMDKLKAIPGFATAKKIFEYGQKIWKVVKPVWDLFEPLMDIIVKRIEEVIDLFDPPPSTENIGQFLWKLAKLLFNLSFGGLSEIASAIRSLLGKAAAFAKKLINKAVQDGHIGVKRHSYYIWMPWPKDDIEFMAAAEWKINIPGVANLGQGGPPGFLLSPSGAVSLVLYEALQAVGIGYTYVGNSDINKPYNDIWTGAGARG